MNAHDELSSLFSRFYESEKETEMSLEDYLKACAREPMAYASAAERMLAAIGEPQLIDTSQETRLGRIFMNRTIRVYPAFQDFYGMEETIERIVGFLRHAAQGLEERKQVLYLLGPVGGGKSSLAERLKLLMERMPIYVLKAGKDMSPIFESPLGLFDPERMGDLLERRYKIPKRRLTGLTSPWALKRLDEFGGDSHKFSVVKVHPSRLRQICIAKTEPRTRRPPSASPPSKRCLRAPPGSRCGSRWAGGSSSSCRRSAWFPSCMRSGVHWFGTPCCSCSCIYPHPALPPSSWNRWTWHPIRHPRRGCCV
ncbi:MAG: hypothetical protein LAN63_10775 [Acidobacteriia bacterium]|nr:hypothetical protein [Terriglobia bacterium]